MIHWMDASLDVRRPMLDASRQAIEVGPTGEAVGKVQASQQATDADVKAWSAWMNRWRGAW